MSAEQDQAPSLAPHQVGWQGGGRPVARRKSPNIHPFSKAAKRNMGERHGRKGRGWLDIY